MSDTASQPPVDIDALQALLVAARAERDTAIAERDQALSQNDRRNDLLDILQCQTQLVRIELLRTAAEVRTLQLAQGTARDEAFELNIQAGVVGRGRWASQARVLAPTGTAATASTGAALPACSAMNVHESW